MPLGHEYLCPITQELMEDPVIAADGISYERRAITQWLQKSKLSPLTGEMLKHTALTPNYGLKAAIDKYREKMPEWLKRARKKRPLRRRNSKDKTKTSRPRPHELV